MQKPSSLRWLYFLSLARPQFDFWKWQSIKCKIPTLIFSLVSLSLTWKLPRPPPVFWFFESFVSIMSLLLAGIILDMAQVLGLILIFFGHLGSIHSSGWMISSITSMTFVFFRNLGLRLIISRWGVMGLSFIFVLVSIFPISIIFVFFGQWPAACWALKVDLSNLGEWLKTSLGFYINNLLYHFFPQIQVMSSIIQLGSNK